MSISPKLSNSTPEQSRAGRWRQKHEAQRHRPEIVSRLIQAHDYQLKFVVASPEDLSEINAYLDEVRSFLSGDLDRSRVLLMPEGIDTETLLQRQTWLEAICQREGFSFCQRHHIFWYGNKRGT
jgi:7-carboxy-7-deazaguanine synthase